MAITVDKINVSYFPVPKVACTSIKHVFYTIENKREFHPSIRNGAHFHIHNYYPSVPFQNNPHDRIRRHHRVCVVRDPIKRFLSSYSNRVCFHKELGKEHLSPKAISAGAEPDPDLEVFVEKLEIYREHSRSIRAHTDPHVFYLGGDRDYYSKIYQMSDLDDLVLDLSARSGIDLELPHKQAGGPKISVDSLSSNAIEKIKKFYDEDYQSYDFL
ncbi:sulfotransferase family 2 domain-containing protein [Paracoccus sp. FO-3]|uniref:sulfotransferase family 2 domain-containing protein n=1 Tax=Paracoccus sp. FO-3 TaxID=1335059 RepID=UPI00112C3F91|nr:sulfotransferase family 2 domain-containing protein [Paracoccus sp. FO-3]